MMVMKGNSGSANDSKIEGKTSRTSLLFYFVLAVVVVVAVAFLVNVFQTVGRNVLENYRVSVSLSTNTPVSYPYQTSYFLVNITNKGSSSIKGLTVGFYMDGSAIRYSSVDVPAGRTVQVVDNYTYLNPGNYTFSAVADPADVLAIKDRSAVQSSVSMVINQTEKPDVYASLPNSNITYTQSFSLTPTGLVAAAATASKYNVSIFTNLFSPARNVLIKLFENLYVAISTANGAYVRYADNTTAYSMWIQGEVQPSLVNYVLSSFYLRQFNTSINGTNVGYLAVNGTTSICYLYSGGWTKIFSYFNNSHARTCLDIAGKKYVSEESNTIVAQIKANKGMVAYQQHFIYINSSSIGSSLIYGNTLSIVDFFENAHGFFTNEVQNTTSFEGTRPLCRGLIYTGNDVSVCSVYVHPTSNASNFGMVNTTELTNSYRLSLYSLVNLSDLTLAHVNGVELLNALNVSNIITWKSTFKNTCSLRNASIGCNVTGFDYSYNTAYLNISNKFPKPLRINTLSCFAPGLRQNETFNVTVNGNSHVNISVACISIPVGTIASLYTNYAFAMNYTYMNSTQSIAGTLNVTNQALH